jgi:GNAT superfamily N-acetyltransferase
MLYAGLSLARRLEAAEAENARACAVVRTDTAVLSAAGGFAVFTGAESPLTHALGVGMNGPVSAAELAGIETFFRARGARPTFELSPLADAGLIEALGERGYRITEFNNVMVKSLANAEIVFTPRVRRAVVGEADMWAHTLGHAFFDKAELTTEEMDIGRDLFGMPGGLCYLATMDGETAAGAGLAIRSGLATLYADGVIARFRGRALQGEMIAARLNEALAQGCDMATASTLPGTASQRNYERHGFQVAYTRITLAA